MFPATLYQQLLNQSLMDRIPVQEARFRDAAFPFSTTSAHTRRDQGHSMRRCAGVSRLRIHRGQKQSLHPRRRSASAVGVLPSAAVHMENLHLSGAQPRRVLTVTAISERYYGGSKLHEVGLLVCAFQIKFTGNVRTTSVCVFSRVRRN